MNITIGGIERKSIEFVTSLRATTIEKKIYCFIERYCKLTGEFQEKTGKNSQLLSTKFAKFTNQLINHNWPINLPNHLLSVPSTRRCEHVSQSRG